MSVGRSGGKTGNPGRKTPVTHPVTEQGPLGPNILQSPKLSAYSNEVYAYGTNTLTYDKPYGVDWESFISGNQSFSNMYATVTETAPIPGAALLFGSALVLIGAIRRRFNQ